MNVATEEERRMKTTTKTAATLLKSRITIALLAATIVTVGMAVVPMLVAAPVGTMSVFQDAQAQLLESDDEHDSDQRTIERNRAIPCSPNCPVANEPEDIDVDSPPVRVQINFSFVPA